MNYKSYYRNKITIIYNKNKFRYLFGLFLEVLIDSQKPGIIHKDRIKIIVSSCVIDKSTIWYSSVNIIGYPTEKIVL